MVIVKAIFDGKVFVPAEQVDLPPGSAVAIVLSTPSLSTVSQESAEWEDLLREIRSAPPYFASPDEALHYSRKRP